MTVMFSDDLDELMNASCFGWEYGVLCVGISSITQDYGYEDVRKDQSLTACP